MPSENEILVANALTTRGLALQTDLDSRRMPLVDWPWKKPRSRAAPTADLYLPDPGIYVEIKGFMTLHAMAKMAWLAQHGAFPYYVFQATEEDWDPFVDALDGPTAAPTFEPHEAARRRRQNVERQAEELAFIRAHPERARACGAVSRTRIARYAALRIREFEAWNGRFP